MASSSIPPAAYKSPPACAAPTKTNLPKKYAVASMSFRLRASSNVLSRSLSMKSPTWLSGATIGKHYS
jgi:hypothetical protein